jgi:cytochrome oxidase Cu insertion factor (SCO1/SenC/PrrC family)
MRKRLLSTIMVAALSVAALPGIAQEAKKAEEPKKAPEPLTLKAGDVAPPFTLLHYDGQGVKPVSLADYRGKKNVILAFFVFAFTGG